MALARMENWGKAVTASGRAAGAEYLAFGACGGGGGQHAVHAQRRRRPPVHAHELPSRWALRRGAAGASCVQKLQWRAREARVKAGGNVPAQAASRSLPLLARGCISVPWSPIARSAPWGGAPPSGTHPTRPSRPGTGLPGPSLCVNRWMSLGWRVMMSSRPPPVVALMRRGPPHPARSDVQLDDRQEVLGSWHAELRAPGDGRCG